jgi:hypothetical protein
MSKSSIDRVRIRFFISVSLLLVKSRLLIVSPSFRQLLCIIVEKEADVAAFKDFKDEGTVAAKPKSPEPAPAAAPAPPASAPQPAAAPSMAAAATPAPSSPGVRPPVSSDGFVRASPLARRLAAERGINLAVSPKTKWAGRCKFSVPICGDFFVSIDQDFLLKSDRLKMNRCQVVKRSKVSFFFFETHLYL